MRKIDKIILSATVPPFLIALMVLTFVVFVRELGRLSELFITRNASLGVIGAIALAILPGILIFSLPLSFLIGSLVGLGGLSGESQITALRACGVPLRRLLLPLLGAGFCVTIATAGLSLFIFPQTADLLEVLKHRISLRQVTSQIQPRIFNEDFPDVVFYLEDLAPERQYWSRVFVAESSDPSSPKIILAREGSWLTDEAGSNLQLHLVDGRVYQVDPKDPSRDSVSVFVSTDIPIALRGAAMSGSEAFARSRRVQRPAEMSTMALWRGEAAGGGLAVLRDQAIELHRRLALPFSAITFAIISLPLGASTRRTGRTTGFVIGLILVLLFYTLLMNGLRLASVGQVTPWAGAWGGNLILLALSLVLFWSAERGGRFAQWLNEWRWKRRPPATASVAPAGAVRRAGLLDARFFSICGRITRRCVPKVLDFYIARGFLIYFLWSVIACAALFVVLTLFELLDDIIKNDISAMVVADYFFSLFPQILILVVPMAVLLASLIHFGILEKASEIVAIKAGGWSLYRICMPVFVLSGTVCLGLYLLQDYVLPYANIRQDTLRNLIKGRPAQTTMPQRKWIIGNSGRIYNYDYFDSSQNRFVGLNVFEIDMDRLHIIRRLHAAQATIDSSGKWILENGWLHDFGPEGPGYRRIARDEFDFPEGASYFKREIFEPKESAKLNYIELRQLISYLEQSGYNATELQVELYKKISFPLSSLVMALLGVPFSFSMGRRGAFFGIAASIVIAIFYWGTFSVFEQMGAYGLLLPMLAAWAPNLLFGGAGLALLLTVRT